MFTHLTCLGGVGSVLALLIKSAKGQRQRGVNGPTAARPGLKPLTRLPLSARVRVAVIGRISQQTRWPARAQVEPLCADAVLHHGSTQALKVRESHGQAHAG